MTVGPRDIYHYSMSRIKYYDKIEMQKKTIRPHFVHADSFTHAKHIRLVWREFKCFSNSHQHISR